MAVALAGEDAPYPGASSFRPSRHGFRFANRFEVPLFGSWLRALGLPATWGLCGGMVQSARAAFLNGRSLPQRETPPAPGTPLYRHLLRRQLATLGPPPVFPEGWRFLRWTRASDPTLARRTRSQLETAQRRLAQGQLVPLGLIYTRSAARLWENHQVLAYARRGRQALRIYDPNDPGRDDITLAPPAADGAGFEKRRDGRVVRPVRGFFVRRAAA